MIIWNPANKTTVESRGIRDGVGHFSSANGPNHHIFEIGAYATSPALPNTAHGCGMLNNLDPAMSIGVRTGQATDDKAGEDRSLQAPGPRSLDISPVGSYG